MYPKLLNEKAWLVQVIHEDMCFCKMLCVGVRESVKAVSAQMIRGDHLVCEDGTTYTTTPNMSVRTCCKGIPGTPYVIGGVYHPDMMAQLVSAPVFSRLHEQAGPLFRAMGIPLLDAWLPALWQLAASKGYATAMETIGVDDLVWRLSLPSSEQFMAHMEEDLSAWHNMAKASF